MRIETLNAREEKIRESWIRTMEARIVREELQKCHKAEGVNHYQACADLAKKYHSLLADAKVSTLRPRVRMEELERCETRILTENLQPFDGEWVCGQQVKGFRVIDTA